MIGEILVERQRLTPSQLSEALLQQPVSGKRIGALLVELGAIDEPELTMAWANTSPPDGGPANAGFEDEGARVPEATARAHTLIPLRMIVDGLQVAMVEPTDVKAIADLDRPRGSPSS